tara:strand:- start:716 stop:1177 length:462 start_codon:yes stop_codon:yes gene_type:complete
MAETYFPILDDEALFSLELIRAKMQENPGFLHDEECPYPGWLIEMLGSETVGAEGVEEEGGDDDEVDLVKETTRLFNDLKKAADNFQTDDHSERMSYFRVSTALLEKLVAMKERSLNVRQVSRFYSTVLELMEEVLEPGQITKIRERLKEYAT